jgi:hypothetical protein
METSAGRYAPGLKRDSAICGVIGSRGKVLLDGRPGRCALPSLPDCRRPTPSALCRAAFARRLLMGFAPKSQVRTGLPAGGGGFELVGSLSGLARPELVELRAETDVARLPTAVPFTAGPSSNPAPSTGESVANLPSGASLRLQRLSHSLELELPRAPARPAIILAPLCGEPLH